MNAAQQLLAQWQRPVVLPSTVVPRTMRLYGRQIAVPSEAMIPQPQGYPYVTKDKLGSPYFVWRGRSK